MKLNEMREKTVEELQGAIIDWKKDLFNYKLQLSTHKLENTALISKTKRLIAQAKTVIKEVLNECEEKNIKEWAYLKNNIKENLKEYLYTKTKRNPMILPIIMEV